MEFVVPYSLKATLYMTNRIVKSSLFSIFYFLPHLPAVVTAIIHNYEWVRRWSGIFTDPTSMNFLEKQTTKYLHHLLFYSTNSVSYYYLFVKFTILFCTKLKNIIKYKDIFPYFYTLFCHSYLTNIF